MAKVKKAKFDERKFAELLLYVCLRSERDPNFGAVKLNKILFFADFLAFSRFGKPITGAVYKALDHGPAPTILPKIKRQLERRQDAFERHIKLWSGAKQKQLLALRDPVLDEFTPQEIALVDEVLDRLRAFTGSEVSVLFHQLPGWELANWGEEIPYEAVFLPERPVGLSKRESDYGHSLARQLR